MIPVASINPRVVEALYIEALVLSDASRERFDQLRQAAGVRVRLADGSVIDQQVSPDDVEMMCEALRTTTRVMHCLAWLLNHRAWFAGEISATQLRRHGRLVTHFPESDPKIVGRLPADLGALIGESEQLYARIQRLEDAWRDERPPQKAAIDTLRDRLAGHMLRQA